MFGGLAFLIAGNMAIVASSRGGAMVRQTRSRIREIEQLNPGVKVTLTPIDAPICAPTLGDDPARAASHQPTRPSTQHHGF
jgi:hypothetical protein